MKIYQSKVNGGSTSVLLPTFPLLVMRRHSNKVSLNAGFHYSYLKQKLDNVLNECHEIKLLTHFMKLFILFPYKYHVTSAKLNAHETPSKLS